MERYPAIPIVARFSKEASTPRRSAHSLRRALRPIRGSPLRPSIRRSEDAFAGRDEAILADSASQWPLWLSAERLALSCEVPRERSDRGLRQLQCPSSAAAQNARPRMRILRRSERRSIAIGGLRSAQHLPPRGFGIAPLPLSRGGAASFKYGSMLSKQGPVLVCPIR